MNLSRFAEITARYPHLRLAVIGDFCLDRYLEIDATRPETSLETGLPVHNVMRIRSQPGAAGTIVNNLVALGVGTIHLVGFCGEDGEGWELQRALCALPGVRLEHFLVTSKRATFTYTKPLMIEPGATPRELNRLDIKNWIPTPESLSARLAAAVRAVGSEVDGIVVMDQVSEPETGVITVPVLAGLRELARTRAQLPILADSRRTLRGFPAVLLKMNVAELAALTGTRPTDSVDEIAERTRALARQHGRAVFVTMAERGIITADASGATFTLPVHTLRGPIDIVGAGDAVTANLVAVLAAGGSNEEAITLANAAASVVVHQVGTTGTAGVQQIDALLAETAG